MVRIAALTAALTMTGPAAAVSVRVSATTTQAVLEIRGADAPCIIDLREGSPNGPLHPDVNSSPDASRPDTIVQKDGTRIVTLGHRSSNLALSAGINYFGKVSGCGDATFEFTTRGPMLGALMPQPLAPDPANWHNAAFPAIDWTAAGRGKWYTDPLTGLKLRIVNAPEDFSWAQKSDLSFGTLSQGSHWAGGAGWQNAGTAVNAANSTAQTSNTNPLFLYPGYLDPWGGMNFENLGLLVWGRCISGTDADCEIEAGITLHPAQGFAGTPFIIRLPAGAMQKIAGSTHKYANGAFPAAYPRPLLAGWGDVRVTVDMRYGPQPVQPDTIAHGVLTITAPTVGIPGHFQRALRPGHHMWVGGSGCSANGGPDICTVAEFKDSGQVTLDEKLNLPKGTQVRGLPWGVMVRKKTATGTVQLGFAYRIAGANNSSTGTLTAKCGPIEQTDPDGVRGHPCAVPARNNYIMLYFISNDGEVVRPVAAMGTTVVAGLMDSISFSPTQGNVFYTRGQNQLWRGVYTGDWKNSPWDTEDTRYIFNPGGDYPYQQVDEHITWTKAIEPDPGVQITEKYPKEVSAPYPAWTSYGFSGVSGDLGVLYRIANGSLVGDSGPCQVAVFNMLTGKLLDFMNSMDAGGPVAFGNCHSVGVNTTVDNTVYLSFNRMPRSPGEANPQQISLGPHHMVVEGILKGGQWDANVRLSWPRDTAAFDSACPEGLSDDYTQLGATGSSCITFLTRGHPCNITPKGNADSLSGDFALYGVCPWNPKYSGSVKLRMGHRFIDTWASNAPGNLDGDSEHFRVLSVADEPGGKLRVVAQFNASLDYCCGSGTRGYNCVSTTNQMTHRTPAEGFTLMMMPGSKASCNASSIHVTYPVSSSPEKTYTELSNRFQGHASYGRGPDGTVRYLSGGTAGTLSTFAELGNQPPINPKLVPVATKFNAVQAPIGSLLQQYLNHTQKSAGNDGTVFSFDANAVNPGAGIAGNDMGNSIATRTLVRVEGDIWQLSVIDKVAYKTRPLLGWAGPKYLRDISAPKSDIAAAPDYSLCFALRAGECLAGSGEGDLYVRVPRAFRHSGWQGDWCQTGMEWADIPCVLSGSPAAGYGRQFRSDRPDTDGADQRLLTSAFRPAGTQYPYWAVVAHPAGRAVLMSSAGVLEGVRHVTFVAKLPAWTDTFPKRNAPGGLDVRIGPSPGMTHARVRFGYNTSFHCTERADACLTDAALMPFAFEHTEKLTPLACVAGCGISVPAMPGRLLYYRIETFDGSAWTYGETETVP